MVVKRNLLVITVVLLLCGMLITNVSSWCASSQLYLGNASAVGTISPYNNITLEITGINQGGSTKTVSIGMVVPSGLIQWDTSQHTVIIPKESVNTTMWEVLVNDTGDFEILFFMMVSGQLESYRIFHLLVQSAPSELPATIVINETVYINETIPVYINQTVDVDSYVTNNNYNNFTLLVNETDYNTIVNNITNNIYYDLIVNVTLSFNISLWQSQNQSQWQSQNQSQWIIFDIPAGIMYGSMAALGLIGVHNVVAGESTFTTRSRRRSKWEADNTRSDNPSEEGWEFNRRVQYGYGLIGAIVGELIGVFLVFQYLPTFIQDNFTYIAGSYAPFFFGLFTALGLFFIILSLDEPIDLLGLAVLGTIFSLFAGLFWFLASAIGLLLLIFIVYWIRTHQQAEIVLGGKPHYTDSKRTSSYLRQELAQHQADAKNKLIRRILIFALTGVLIVSAILVVLDIITLLFIWMILPIATSFIIFALIAENIVITNKWIWIPFVTSTLLLGIVLVIVQFFMTAEILALILGCAIAGLQIGYIALAVMKASDERFWGLALVIGVFILFGLFVVGGILFASEILFMIGIILLAIGCGILAFLGIAVLLSLWALATALE